jgi:LemA protein
MRTAAVKHEPTPLEVTMSAWIALLVVLLVATLVAYNGLVRSRERTREAWSGIDVQLTRRADLVPALVEVVAGYASHERETLTAVMEARASLVAAARPAVAANASAELGICLGQLFMVAEGYPELRAVESFVALQDQLTDLEEKLAYSRQFYNRNALDFNTRIRRFPTFLLARALRLPPFEFFDADEGAAELEIRFVGRNPRTGC